MACWLSSKHHSMVISVCKCVKVCTGLIRCHCCVAKLQQVMVCRLQHHKLVARTAALCCLSQFLCLFPSFWIYCIYFCIPLSFPQTWILRRLCCISQHVEVFFGLRTSCCSSQEREQHCDWLTEKATHPPPLQPCEDTNGSTSSSQSKNWARLVMTVKGWLNCAVIIIMFF